MALRVYGDAALPQVERDVAVVGRHIIRHKLRRFNAKRMRREAGYNGPKDATRLHAALTSSQTVTGSTKRARGLATRRAASPPTTPSIRGCMAMGKWLDKAQRQTRADGDASMVHNARWRSRPARSFRT